MTTKKWIGVVAVVVLIGFAIWYDGAESSTPVAKVATSAPRQAAPLRPISPQPTSEPDTKVAFEPPLQAVTGNPAAKMISNSKDWKNVGRGTVSDTIQSQYWAIAGGDIVALEKGIYLDEHAIKWMGGLMEGVPAKVRAEYGTPEKLAAFLLASAPELKGYLVTREEQMGENGARATVFTLRPGEGKFDGERQEFRREEDGTWRRVIGARELSMWRDMMKWESYWAKSGRE
ncbi:MAG: hypothetical protein V4773_13275 [Verrucomicrobiota bacterium]